MCEVVILPEGATHPSDLGDDAQLIPVPAGALALLEEDQAAATLLDQVVCALTTSKPTKLWLLADAARALLVEACGVVLGETYDQEVCWSGNVVLGNLQDGAWCLFREIPICYSRT